MTIIDLINYCVENDLPLTTRLRIYAEPDDVYVDTIYDHRISVDGKSSILLSTEPSVNTRFHSNNPDA